jgi:hypothetical protein
MGDLTMHSLLRTLVMTCGLLVTTAQPALAADPTLPGWLDRVVDEVTTTARDGTSEIYFPVRTYHMRWAYTKEKIDSFQEFPLGLGYGRGRLDEQGNWHGLYAMGFQDSHFKPEWLAGYGWKTYWRLSENTRFGLGYTAGFTARSDLGSYTPVPVILPIGSIDYRETSLEAAYVPGGKGFGNILFFWLKWHPGYSSSTSKVTP